MEKLRKIASLASLIPLLFLPSCQEGFNLIILNQYQPRLVFCLTAGAWWCDGNGIQLNTGITIYRTNINGDDLETVWKMAAGYGGTHANVVNIVEYGHVPPGWTEIIRAKPLRYNTYYSFDGRAYFTRNIRGEYKVLPPRNFYKRTNSATPNDLPGHHDS
jgi:hypothetical protein